MHDIVCLNCEKIVPYDAGFQGYICKYCGWKQATVQDNELVELKREIFNLKEQLKAYEHLKTDETDVRIGDIRYCIFSGGKDHRACVLKSELYRTTTNHLKTTYSFKPLETDYPPRLSYSGELFKRTFKDKEKAEKALRKFLRRRQHGDGRIRPLKSQRQIAEENRAKHEAESEEDDL